MVHAMQGERARQLDGNIDRGSAGKYIFRACRRTENFACDKRARRSGRIEWTDVDGIDQI